MGLGGGGLGLGQVGMEGEGAVLWSDGDGFGGR